MKYLFSAMPPDRHKRSVRALLAVIVCALAIGGALLLAQRSTRTTAPLLLAPMLHGTDLCAAAEASPPPSSPDMLASFCLRTGRSAASIVEAKLAELGPALSRNGRFEIGYTLQVPLLALFVPDGTGWRIDPRAVERLALTVQETARPVVLYLFSTHFGIRAPLEEALAQDPLNLAASPNGPMLKDKYQGIDIYPWTFASTDNGITRYREQAIDAFAAAVCRLPQAHQRKIRGVTLLGELHHFYADFERGMGLGGPYVVSDYSEASKRGFRIFLAERFGRIDVLNKLVGESYSSFTDVEPPGKDFRSGKLSRFTEHIDSSAHGRLPLAGWTFDTAAEETATTWVRVFLNGEQVARVPARYGRQDVLQAKPGFGTADVGWRFDLDFTQLRPGTHHLDFIAERASRALAHLATRRVSILDRKQPPQVQPAAALPVTGDATGLEGHVDFPPDGASFLYNPLVPLWHEFRGKQIVRYLEHFERRVRATCLRKVDVYTHQITPFTNPGWDTTKFAVDASLRDPGGLRPGVSLYGEPTYGSSFFDWLATTEHQGYGVTEFHPLRELSPQQVSSMFEQHRRRGARFISFFFDVRPNDMRQPGDRNIYAINPDNPSFSSDRLFAAIRNAINE